MYSSIFNIFNWKKFRNINFVVYDKLYFDLHTLLTVSFEQRKTSPYAAYHYYFIVSINHYDILISQLVTQIRTKTAKPTNMQFPQMDKNFPNSFKKWYLMIISIISTTEWCDLLNSDLHIPIMDATEFSEF